MTIDKLTEAQKQILAAERNVLENHFDTVWKWLDGPELESDFEFHPSREWEFDRAFPALMIAIEIEGGTWVGGRHTREPGFTNDCEKYNAAARLGWRVFRLTSLMLEDPDQYIKSLVDYLSQWSGSDNQDIVPKSFLPKVDPPRSPKKMRAWNELRAGYFLGFVSNLKSVGVTRVGNLIGIDIDVDKVALMTAEDWREIQRAVRVLLVDGKKDT